MPFSRVFAVFTALLLASNHAIALPYEDFNLEDHVVEGPSLEPRQAGRFTFYNMPTPAAGPCDLATGPDGNLWGEDILIEKLFRVNPRTGRVTEYNIPFTTPISNQTIPGVPFLIQDRTALACAIRTAGDGNIYATNGVRNQLVRINPNTGRVRVFQPPPNPAGNLFNFNDITPAPGGLWMTQTTGNIFQFFDFATESFTKTYPIPSALALPLGCLVASNGLLYIAEFNRNKILEFNPRTEQMREYTLPLPAQYPAVIRAERNGWVYFSLFTGNGNGRINLRTKKIELYPTNQIGGLGAVNTQDSRGGVWLSFFTTNVMARLDTHTLRYSYVPFPGTFAEAGLNGLFGNVPPYVDISVNYGPGDAIWFGSITKNQVGRYSLS